MPGYSSAQINVPGSKTQSESPIDTQEVLSINMMHITINFILAYLIEFVKQLKFDWINKISQYSP